MGFACRIIDSPNDSEDSDVATNHNFITCKICDLPVHSKLCLDASGACGKCVVKREVKQNYINMLADVASNRCKLSDSLPNDTPGQIVIKNMSILPTGKDKEIKNTPIE